MPIPHFPKANRQHPAAATPSRLREGIAHQQAGRVTEAREIYHAILAATPDHAETLQLLGILEIQARRADAAIAPLRRAQALRPDNAEISNNLGIAFMTSGKPEAAAAQFRRALERDPGHIDALAHLGNALREMKQAREALDCYEKLLALQPDNIAVQVGMGICWWHLNDLDRAIACFETVLARDPNHIEALVSLGGSHWAADRVEEARAVLERALRLAPDSPRALTGYGSFLHDRGEIERAVELYDRALAIAPDFSEARWSKSLGLLALGDYREGWKLFETGLGHASRRGADRFAGVKPWDGTPMPQGRLLVWNEQGFGDALHFVRYAALCKPRVGHVTVICPKPLVRLFKTLSGVDAVFDRPPDGSHFDQHVSMMSLPHVLETTVETVPADVPYLHADPALAAKWAAKFAKASEQSVRALKIGLVWAGGAHDGGIMAKLTDSRRSVGLARMKPWLALPGARFYSLQKDEPSRQIAELALQGSVTDYMGDVGDFADTAALIAQLDLIISVDTSVAHLAGAMGKPVWILSRYNACWRWLRNRPETPWYPTARLYGQPTMGDWDQVSERVGQDLAKLLAARAVAAKTTN